jgi:hypothetical protein
VHGDDLSDEAIATVYAEVAAAGMLRPVPRRTGPSTTELLPATGPRAATRLAGSPHPGWSKRQRSMMRLPVTSQASSEHSQAMVVAT